MEYLGSKKNIPNQLDGLNVEYLGSKNYSKSIRRAQCGILMLQKNIPNQLDRLAATNSAKTLCCGQQERMMFSLAQQQQTTWCLVDNNKDVLSC
jgi:hypothetical protein